MLKERPTLRGYL
uniref:Uncharacterized protein n=1 Tax=Anguilla anguilla TaxID=7936 RepID=A0A0E9V164_ANGAN